MRRFFRFSLMWLTPLVIVLIAMLLVLQYRFLRTLEQTTASAERNSIRNAVERVRLAIDSYYRSASQKSLDVGEAARLDPELAAAHFRVNPIAGAKTYFITRYDQHAVATRWFDADGAARELPPEEELHSIKIATVSWHVAHKLGRVVGWPDVHVDERDPHMRVIMRPLTDESLHVVGLAGVVLDEAKAQEAMLRIGRETLRDETRSGEMKLHIGKTFPTMPRGRDFLTQPLGFVFTRWQVGLTDAVASPEELAAYNFRLNALWTGLVILMLAGSVALAMHAAARSMRVSQMKSEFVSNVSHELRTPLSSIRVFGEYMRLGRVTKDEKIREYGEYIEAESRRLTQLINNILDFSKIESAEKKYRFAVNDLVELVTQTVAAFEVPMRDQGIRIALETPAAPMPLHFDRDALGQAVINLLDNAVKYSNGRKEIEVRVTSNAAEARVAIRDHGIGVPLREQKKIFEKFYRVGSGLVHDVKGSGLGLAIVQHVVQAHGGRVDVASTPGEGSVFTIVLPLAGGDAVAVPTTAEYA
jgi:signal transduction histidine kinase